MPETPDQPTPRRTSATRSSSRRRFALPPDHHEELSSERTAERIEAFLDGPTRVRRTRRRSTKAPARPRPVVPMDTRTDWDKALRLEDARVARYGRPASVLVIELASVAPGALDRHAARIGSVIRTHARETDRVARVAPTRFHVLLPETDEAEAGVFVERLGRACREAMAGSVGPGVDIRTAAAGAPASGTLGDALAVAEGRLAG